MSKAKLAWHVFALCTIIALVGWWVAQIAAEQSSADYPSRPIHVVVPYKAGGGSDTFVRIIQRGIVEDHLLDQPLVIINQDGGIGTIGSRDVKNAEPDGYKILCHHNAIITAKLTETVSYGPEAFEPIALTGEMSMVILCREDARFKNIADLLEQAKQTPKAIRFGANKGAPAYFTTLQMERAWPGAEFSVVSAGGGADRYSKILGGHLEAGIFSLSEYLDFRGIPGTPPDQNIRAIALLSKQRHASIPDVPTAVELGVPVVLTNANYWWAPKGTPKPIVEKLASVLREAMQNETVRSELARLRMEPSFEQGDTFKKTLEETVQRFEAVVARKQASLPDFPVYVGALVALLFVFVVMQSIRGREVDEEERGLGFDESFVKRPGIAVVSLVALCGYVLLLGRGWVPFAIATTAMVVVIGGIMIRGQKANWIVLFELALLTGFGAQFIFTELFVTALP